MGSTSHLVASSEIFVVLRNIVTLVVINMYLISVCTHLCVGYFFIIVEPSEESITVPFLSVLYIVTLFSFKRLTVPSFG